MRILVVGGGKVGSHLAVELSAMRHAVTLIEPDPVKAQRIGELGEVVVFNGDGTDIELLQAVRAHRMDWLLAVTGHDEVNLVACQLALTLGTRRVLARMNDPRNRRTFDALEIPVVAVTDLMARVIEREVDLVDLVRVPLADHGDAVVLVDVELPGGFAPRAVFELRLPPPTILVGRIRGDAAAVTVADTPLEPGDRVLAVTVAGNEEAVRAHLRGEEPNG